MTVFKSRRRKQCARAEPLTFVILGYHRAVYVDILFIYTPRGTSDLIAMCVPKKKFCTVRLGQRFLRFLDLLYVTIVTIYRKFLYYMETVVTYSITPVYRTSVSSRQELTDVGEITQVGRGLGEDSTPTSRPSGSLLGLEKCVLKVLIRIPLISTTAY
jgi:hypothetical protein